MNTSSENASQTLPAPLTVVMGIGNELLGDEGLGVHAARALAARRLPATVRVLEAGTNLLDALPHLEDVTRLIVLDAILAGGTPGTVYRMPLSDCRRPATIASMHGFDIGRVLELAGRQAPCEVVVIGVEPASIGWSLTLSDEVASALPELLAAVAAELGLGELPPA